MGLVTVRQQYMADVRGLAAHGRQFTEYDACIVVVKSIDQRQTVPVLDQESMDAATTSLGQAIQSRRNLHLETGLDGITCPLCTLGDMSDEEFQLPDDMPVPPATFEFFVLSMKMQAEMSMGLIHFGEEKIAQNPTCEWRGTRSICLP